MCNKRVLIFLFLIFLLPGTIPAYDCDGRTYEVIFERK